MAVQAQREAASIPDGMRLLSEEERLETLSLLARSKADVEDKLQVICIIHWPAAQGCLVVLSQLR